MANRDDVAFAERWLSSLHLESDSDVPAFTRAAQELPLEEAIIIQRAIPHLSDDRRELAIAALRCRRFSVFFNPRAGNYIIAGPALGTSFRGKSTKMIAPGAPSTRSELLAPVPSRTSLTLVGGRSVGRAYTIYALMLLFATLVLVGAIELSGVASIVLFLISGLLFALTLWSVVILSRAVVIQRLVNSRRSTHH